MKTLYGERDVEELDEVHNLYCKHINAMTTEGLHSKSSIAAELAWRDWKIMQLEQSKGVRVDLEVLDGVVGEPVITATVPLLRVDGSDCPAPKIIGIIDCVCKWVPGAPVVGLAHHLITVKGVQLYTYEFTDPEFKLVGELPQPQIHYIGDTPAVTGRELRSTIYAISLV